MRGTIEQVGLKTVENPAAQQPRPHLLPLTPTISSDLRARVSHDHERFGRAGLPSDLDAYLRDTYGLDMTASYAGVSLRNPWGKASGQLSLNRAQVEEAALAGLGLVVLKTVIAQDQSGRHSMSEWAVKETQMVAEPIASPRTGAVGWTITWKGRGWWESLDAYLELVRQSAAIGRQHGMLVVPSVKFHLPAAGEAEWRIDEYTLTTRAILDAFQSGGGELPMALEKDFSPTLAGSDRAVQRATVIEWLRRVPALIRSAVPARYVRAGLKIFNSLDSEEFQLAMLAEVHRSPERPDFLAYANRLFDPDREFEGKHGVAYGGPDLSDRNLRLLSALRSAQEQGQIDADPLELSGTGDIHSGRIAVEYALRGCTSFQIHTLFQLPASEFAMRSGSKVHRALHRLYFDPREGFILWAHHAANCLGLVSEGGLVRFLDLARRGTRSALVRRDLDSEAH
jgi:hypothetical protein